jgi:hypothetical protein
VVWHGTATEERRRKSSLAAPALVQTAAVVAALVVAASGLAVALSHGSGHRVRAAMPAHAVSDRPAPHRVPSIMISSPAPHRVPSIMISTTSVGLSVDRCASAIAYLELHAAPGFRFECPGYALGHQSMVCMNIPGVCPGSKLIAISTVCPASYENEASNSWVLIGESDARIDPFGHC